MSDIAKAMSKYYTKRELRIIAESLDAYDRLVVGSKQTRFEANRLQQIFRAASEATT